MDRSRRRTRPAGRGPGVQDGLSATTGPEGRVEVFACAVDAGLGVLKRWRQTEPGAALRLDPDFSALEPEGPPTATGGRVVHRLADGNAGKIGHTWRTQSGAWVAPARGGGRSERPHPRPGALRRRAAVALVPVRRAPVRGATRPKCSNPLPHNVFRYPAAT
ncbi:hypothetical protein [Crossiella sp. NPDC003009]